MALTAMTRIKASEIPNAVEAIPAPLRDTLMKYVYKGFENPKDYPSNILLVWHEKVFHSIFSSIHFHFDRCLGPCSHGSRLDRSGFNRSSNRLDPNDIPTVMNKQQEKPISSRFDVRCNNPWTCCVFLLDIDFSSTDHHSTSSSTRNNLYASIRFLDGLVPEISHINAETSWFSFGHR